MSEALFNGGAPGAALAEARGLHYGDGVFRTLLWWQSAPVDWERQWTRLDEDCRTLGLSAPPADVLLEDLRRLGAARAEGVMKILCWRQTQGRGYRPTTSAVDRLVLHYPLPEEPPEHWRQGVIAARSALCLASQPALAGLKHLNRLEQVFASRQWQPGAQEMLMTDAAGHPVCGSRSNLFWVSGGELFTPDLADCGVRGMMRGRILDLAASLGIVTRIVPAPWQALVAADEAFICNSLIGLWPLRELEGRRWAAPGVLTRKLMSALGHPRPPA